MKKKLLYRLIISHLLALFAFQVGVSPFALIVFAVLLVVRGLGLTVAYHRYFAHRSYKVGRVTQFLLALWGGLCAQRGPLWWAAKHRQHHSHSDSEGDPHSPWVDGFWHAHMGWALKADSMETDYGKVKDFAKYPELKVFNQYHDLYMLLFAASLYFLGDYVGSAYPELQTSGPQILVWGYVINTLVHVHLTFLVNSIGHLKGRQPLAKYRVEPKDKSGNLWWLALLTFGEGWHHNHHTYPYSARVGLLWYEFDPGYYTIKMMQALGLARNIKVPKLIPSKGSSRSDYKTFQFFEKKLSLLDK